MTKMDGTTIHQRPPCVDAVKGVMVTMALVLAGCGSGRESRADGYGRTYEAESDQEDRLEDARANLEGLTYQDQHGSLGCTDDCSGHDAGYEWAQQNEIEDAGDCGGNSVSFIEGCEAYAEDLQTEVEDVADSSE